MTEKTSDYNTFAEQWAEQLRKGENLAHEYIEKPAMYAKLPNLEGKDVLCIGCGTGEECTTLLERGARRIVGIDNSEGMITVARRNHAGHAHVEFLVQDMENLSFPNDSFDFVYSSLVLHYVRDWRLTLSQVNRVLRPGGRFVFSTHHPVMWSSEISRTGKATTKILGYHKDTTTKPERISTFGDYLNTHQKDDVWFDALQVTYYCKPLGEILQEIRESGFFIHDFVEPKATLEAKDKDEDFYALHQRIPIFMIFELAHEPLQRTLGMRDFDR